jgi:hypothetical protein
MRALRVGDHEGAAELIDMSDTEITTTIGRPAPTLARLHELLVYEPEVGLRWRIQRGRARAGSKAGGRHHSGHRRIGIDRASYRLDRIVGLYVGTLGVETEGG